MDLRKYILAFPQYEAFFLVGFIMVVLTLVKLFGLLYIDSDWFWFIAGVGLLVQGMISLIKQKKFVKRYKIIERKK
ncbi:hypothetical protein GOV12_02530 [Candidatus Pacearchaeota archaeon]|nr:hypothetical protein [Candidatus Pacearchaeota archaeon]